MRPATIASPLVLALVAIGAWPAALPGAAAGAGPQAFLAEQLGIDGAEWREIAAGKVVARTLPSADGREVATVGVVHLNVPPDFYVAQLRVIESFKKHDAVLQIGTFGTPARLADIAGLTLPRDDIDELRRCRPGDCGVQLPENAIQRFASTVRWSSPQAPDQANDVMRELLVEMIGDYRASGDAALKEYRDAKRPVSPAREFRAMVAAPPALLQRFPSLHAHILRFPSSRSPDTEDVIYWSKEKTGPMPVISVTHLAIARLRDDPVVAYAAASRQLYGSHYFDASLGLTLLLVEDKTGAAGTWLVYVNRSRIDALGGVFGGVKRTVVRSRTRSGMSATLTGVRRMVERRFAARAPQ